MTKPMGRTARIACGCLAAALSALAAPALAAATSTDVSINTTLKTLTVRAATNSTNNVAVSADIANNKVLITDTGSGVATNDLPCTTPVPGTVACPLGLLSKIEVTLNNRDDTAAIAGSVPSSISSSLDGGSGNDQLFGGNGADSLTGSSNNDFMDGGFGPDTYAGGSSSDVVSYATRSTGVSASIGGPARFDGGAQDGPPGGADTINGDVETLVGGAGPDFLVGDSDANALFGGEGADFLVGERGGDFLDGGPGSDFVVGNTGNDSLHGGAGADSLRGNRDFDRLFAFDGERDTSLNCGPGRDRLFRDAIDPRGKSCSRHRHRHRHHRR